LKDRVKNDPPSLKLKVNSDSGSGMMIRQNREDALGLISEWERKSDMSEPPVLEIFSDYI
jgi:hypothetical protein